jgi:hypothetical protein
MIPAIDKVIYMQLVMLVEYHEKAIHKCTSDSQILCWNYYIKYQNDIKS